MENLRSFARETAGKGWQDLKWGSDGPPQDNTDIARCQATTAAMWRDFMTKNPSASGGGWRNPARRVNAAGDGVTQPRALDQHELAAARTDNNVQRVLEATSARFLSLVTSLVVFPECIPSISST
jgi:hypothetical protein